MTKIQAATFSSACLEEKGSWKDNLKYKLS